MRCCSRWILVVFAVIGLAGRVRPLQDYLQQITDEPPPLLKRFPRSEPHRGATQREGRICSSIDIRNSVNNFEKLRNCSVVEGFLRILLIDHGRPENYEGLSFPELREVTEYFLLYRARGLQTLRHLFPNLTVIRGLQLVHNYAFVVYEMQELKEIGLGRLNNIMKGSVYIYNNYYLCYIHTIDWNAIAPDGGHVISQNRKTNMCANNCSSCPVDTRYNGTGIFQRNLCWGKDLCQTVCPHCNGGACDAKGNCCHEDCAGGCQIVIGGKTQPSQCDSCRYVNDHGWCRQDCGQHKYKVNGWRCVSKPECNAIGNGTNDIYKAISYDVKGQTRRECLKECPAEYMEKENKPHECEKCLGTCPKECVGNQIENLHTSAQFRGCTKVNGGLEIQINGGGNIIVELEENLKLIEEVDFLKVVRSVPLVSLNFLRGLRYIRGSTLANNKYAVYVYDNPNLESLWDFSNQNLTIGRGNIFFHANPKLCPYHIEQLQKKTNLPEPESMDVSPNSNGDRVPCNVSTLHVHLRNVSSWSAILSWPAFIPDDYRELIGYVVYYRESSQNVTKFDHREACGSAVWRTEDVAAKDGQNDYNFTIEILKPYTRYAVYVRTVSIAAGRKGAESDIIYFLTRANKPGGVQNLEVKRNSAHSLFITWDPPIEKNGNISYYLLKVSQLPEDDSIREIRDFCDEQQVYSMLNSKDMQTSQLVTEAPLVSQSPSPGPGCCSCQEDDKIESPHDKEHSINVENFIHNLIYLKRPDALPSDISENLNRSRRSISNWNKSVTKRYLEPHQDGGELYRGRVDLSHSPSPRRNELDRGKITGILPVARTEASTLRAPTPGPITKKTKYTSDMVEGLHHHTRYDIEVQACNVDGSKEHCSDTIKREQLTLPLPQADAVNQSTIEVKQNSTTRTVTIRWDDPVEPNSLILAYEIHYQWTKADGRMIPFRQCLPYHEFHRQGGFVLHDLDAGSYIVMVQVTTLNGHGGLSEPVAFTVIGDSEGGLSVTVIVVICITSVLFLTALLGSCIHVYYRKKREEHIAQGMLVSSVNPEYAPTYQYEPDEWEVPRSKIKLIKELGQGSFGMVYEGEATDLLSGKGVQRCAVKTVNDAASLREKHEFLNEASVMKEFNCHHVVKLLGVVSKGQPTLVIMELMACGDLKRYLRSHRPDTDENPGLQPPTLKQILQMAIEIADGMAYLAERKYVHRDLAARNCMVSDELTVKIGDFGMTRDIYETDYYRKGGKGLLPVRWMAPESLKDGVFTSQSDVWSYGVVLWEMATLASQPYQGLSNEQVLMYVIDRGVMEKPENCPDKLYDLMKLCWQYSPKARPTFLQVIELLLPDALPSFSAVSFFCNKEAHSHKDPPAAPSAALNIYHDTANATTDYQESDCFKDDDPEDEPTPSTPLKTKPKKSSASSFVQLFTGKKNNRKEPDESALALSSTPSASPPKYSASPYKPSQKNWVTSNLTVQETPQNGLEEIPKHSELYDQGCWSKGPFASFSGFSGSAKTATGRNHRNSGSGEAFDPLSGSKGMSLSSSDGSKESKTSTCSVNGSVVNGHVRTEAKC